MSFMAKDVIRRNGGNLDMQKLEDLQDDATALGSLADTAITTAQTGVAMVADNRLVKVIKVALAASDAGGGVFAWQNPEAGSILVTRVVLDVTTKATGACTIDVGTTATSAATPSDTLLDGLDVGTAAGVFDNLLAADAGTHGKTAQKLAAGKWVTASKASGATAGIVGSALIEYILV